MVKPKEFRGKKAKYATATEPAAQSTTPVVTHLATKAAAEAFATPVSVAVGSLSTVPSTVLAVAS